MIVRQKVPESCEQTALSTSHGYQGACPDPISRRTFLSGLAAGAAGVAVAA